MKDQTDTGGEAQSALDRHYELVGRILAHMAKVGLKRVTVAGASDLRSEIAPDASSQISDQDIQDVIVWMIGEGLLRNTLSGGRDDGALFAQKVQLTSLGLTVIERRPTEGDTGSIKEEVETQGEGLSSSAYTKIGSFVGGLLGGLTKSLGSG